MPVEQAGELVIERDAMLDQRVAVQIDQDLVSVTDQSEREVVEELVGHHHDRRER